MSFFIFFSKISYFLERVLVEYIVIKVYLDSKPQIYSPFSIKVRSRNRGILEKLLQLENLNKILKCSWCTNIEGGRETDHMGGYISRGIINDRFKAIGLDLFIKLLIQALKSISFRMSDSSSSEEEDVPQFTKNATQDFFKTLTALKNNDPR